MQLVVLKPGGFLKIPLTLRLSDGMTQVLVLLQQLCKLLELAAFLLPAATQTLQALRNLQPFALKLDPLLLRSLLRRQQRQFHPLQIRFSLLHHLGFGGHLDLQLGSCLIDQIDRLVRQAAIADVTVRQTIGGLDRFIGNLHPVMELVALLEASQDLEAESQIGLSDQHLLKASVEGGILLNGEPVILRRRGTDAAQITPSQSRFEQAAGIGAAAVTAHHGVEFIDEQHHS